MTGVAPSLTPRTDAFGEATVPPGISAMMLVRQWQEFARGLERELADASRALSDVTHERDRLRETLTTLTKDGHYHACLAGQRGYGDCSLFCRVVRAGLSLPEAPK